MKKQDLKDGMIIELRNGKRYLLVNDIMRDFDGYMMLADFSEDLKFKDREYYDIIKVYGDTMRYSLISIFEDRYLTLIWEREETKLTDREIEVLKALKTLGYKYIARDANGDLYSYKSKPKKFRFDWVNNEYHSLINEENIFNFIKWKDNKPTKIDDLLKGV